MLSRRIATAVALMVTGVVALASGRFSGAGRNPSLPVQLRARVLEPERDRDRRIEGDVYVADIGTDTVYKFDAAGNPVDFSALGTNALTGARHRPARSPSRTSLGTPAAIAIDNSTNPSDPSAGDLYVMDAGHNVIDKFSSERRIPRPDHRLHSRAAANCWGSASTRRRPSGVDLTRSINRHCIRRRVQRLSGNSLVDEQVTRTSWLSKERVSPAVARLCRRTDRRRLSARAACSCIVSKFGQQLAGFGHGRQTGSRRCRRRGRPRDRPRLRRRAVLGCGVGHRGDERRQGSQAPASISKYPEGVGVLRRFGSLQLSGVSGAGRDRRGRRQWETSTSPIRLTGRSMSSAATLPRSAAGAASERDKENSDAEWDG